MEKLHHAAEVLRWTEVGKAVRVLLETTSITAIVTTIIGWVPPVVASLPALFYGILIWEKFTGKKIADRRKKSRKED